MKRILLVVIFLFGCGKMRGTGTGNPAQSAAGAPVDQTVSFQVLDAVCNRVKSCHPASYSECMTAVAKQTTFAAKLGLQVAPVPSGEMLQYLESSGVITPSAGPSAACLRDIDTLACSASDVQNAYDPNVTDPYYQAAEMLSANCVNVFGP